MQKEATATSKYLRLSPNKVRRVLNQIRGRKYQEALIILEFMPYKACKNIKKLLESAADNANQNYGYQKNNLFIHNAFVNSGPKIKRFQPRAQGRAFKINKPTCHMTIKLTYTSLTN
uniref:Large ribosomal subunit protein uL22c n=1 Tax=Synarthrophyton chejuense TaxID=2485825 RepID=A0A3G3MFW9_9FLOR|nr:ribosomal protein L22 [Synarthrophyton chejuense]AYR05729.1 ribosomal protein L22 [Synarthrophyton chejuense]